MSDFLEYGEGEPQEGYEPFKLNGKNVKANKGALICYVLKRDYDSYRGTFRPRYNVIDCSHYSQLIFENGDAIDMRDVLDCCIKKER